MAFFVPMRTEKLGFSLCMRLRYFLNLNELHRRKEELRKMIVDCE